MKILIVLIILLLIPVASALPEPTVTYIPQNFSANASILVIVDPHTSNPVRVNWIVPGFWEHDRGSFHKHDDRYVCFFSKAESTCGPSPYRLPTTTSFRYTTIIDAIQDEGNLANTTLRHQVGSINVDPRLDVVDNSLIISWSYPGSTNQLRYEIYDAETLLETDQGSIPYNASIFGYGKEVALEDGEYYVAFSIDVGTDFGGTVKKIVVGDPVQPNVTDPDQPLTTSFVQVEFQTFDIIVDSGSSISKGNYKIVNIHNETLTGLSIDVPSELQSIMDAELQDTELEENQSTFYSIRISNIQTSLIVSTRLTLRSGSTPIAIIPVNFSVSVRGGEVVTSTDALEMTGDPVIFGEVLPSSPMVQTYGFENKGSQTITVRPDVDTEIQSSVTITPSSLSLGPGQRKELTVEFSASLPRTYRGSIQFNSEAGSKTVVLDIIVYPNLDDELTATDERLTEIKGSLTPDQEAALLVITADIESLLTDVDTNLDSRSYSTAKRKLSEANAKMEVVELIATDIGGVSAPAPIPPELLSLVVIIVIIAGVAIVAWFVLTKLRKPKSDEKQLEEEFDSSSLKF